MKIGQRATLEDFTSSTWEDFARDIGMGAPFVRRRAGVLAECTLAALPAAGDDIADLGFEGAELRRIQEVVTRRAQTVLDLSAKVRGGG
jgi:serine/threonine-protein kinase HipA